MVSFRVPPTTNAAVLHNHRFRDPINEVVMETQAKGQTTEKSERNVVPGQINSLESVMPLEFRQAVGPSLAIRKIRVPEVGNSSFRTRPDGLRDERIGRRLVTML